MEVSARRLLISGLAWLVMSGGVLAFSEASASAFLGYGNRTSVFGEAGSGAGQFSLHPESTAPGAGVAVDDATHDVYISDTENNRVEKFTAGGVFIAAWGWGVSDGEAKFEICTTTCQPGLPGAGEGQFSTPVSVAVDNSTGASAGDVYVADRGNLRIDKFAPAGVALGNFGAVGDPGSAADPLGGLAAGMKGGNSVFVDPGNGNIWVADAENKRAVEYSPSGEYVAQINDSRISENAFGLTVDSSGDVYLVNGGARVEEFGPAPSFGFIRNLNDSVAIEECCHARAVVTNAANEVFVGDNKHGYQIRQYGAGVAESPPATTFGESIGGSTGVAIDSTTGTIYVADGPNEDVDVFALVQLANVSTGESSNVKGTNASVAGTVDPEGVETHYFFEYGTTNSYGLSSAEETSSAGTDQPVTASLTGLEPNTTYHYRLAATNANGVSRGADREFKTGPVIAEVSTASASNIGINTVTLNGRLNPEEGVETNYYFQYGVTTEYGASSELAASSVEGLISATAAITELEPGTTYHYRIVAFIGAGGPGLETDGEDQEFSTFPAKATVNDSPPFATGVAPHEATLHGTINPGRGVTIYRFVYGTTEGYGSSTPEAFTQRNYEDDAVGQLITGLQPGTIYHYALIATNASGTTIGPDKTFTTLPTPTTEPRGEEESTSPPVLPPSIAPPGTVPILTTPVFPPEPRVISCKKGFVKKGKKCVRKRSPRPKKRSKKKK